MLIIELGGEEMFNEETQRFSTLKRTTVRLEHSLISISKWESIWEKPFIPKMPTDVKSIEEEKSYVKCMVIGSVSEDVLATLWHIYSHSINDYIIASNTATTFKRSKSDGKGQSEFVTSELIYYWMIVYNIPIEAQRWHLNRLLTLIEICNVKQSPNKTKRGRMTKGEIRRQQRNLNQQRRTTLNSSG